MWLVDLPFNWSCYPKQVSEFCGDDVFGIFNNDDEDHNVDYNTDGYTCGTADIEAYLVGGGVNEEFHARTVELMCLT